MVERFRTLDRLRQPEYTGENRCTPCTIVNVAIAVALAAAVAVVSPLAAPIAFGLSLAAIYLRGYLVPGTPTLTKRYFPDRLLAKFDKEPAPGGPAIETGGSETGSASAGETDAGEPVEPVDLEAYFLERDVIAPCLAGDGTEDLCLDEELREAWRAEIESVRDADVESEVAAFLEIDPERVTVVGSTDRATARVDGRSAARWESEAALIADVAASRVLGDRLPDWGSRPLDQRSQLSSGLRAFVERCPSCGGSISVDAETVESCCRSYEVYAITCDDCESRMLEVRE
ncbi:hypothetical protein [Halosolutus gelatinilyticus]|uniref:hypothetical protein n=1 Tax=Halosolutus gelatinilyticus TaxID=2931975 RepID=UPI001FF44846|nr:hypothetical protein [Halosolutus gelatinilyticus]